MTVFAACYLPSQTATADEVEPGCMDGMKGKSDKLFANVACYRTCDITKRKRTPVKAGVFVLQRFKLSCFNQVIQRIEDVLPVFFGQLLHFQHPVKRTFINKLIGSSH